MQTFDTFNHISLKQVKHDWLRRLKLANLSAHEN